MKKKYSEMPTTITITDAVNIIILFEESGLPAKEYKNNILFSIIEKDFYGNNKIFNHISKIK